MAVYYNLNDLPQKNNVQAFWQTEELNPPLYDQTSNHYDFTNSSCMFLYQQNGIIDKCVLDQGSTYVSAEGPGQTPCSLFENRDEFTFSSWIYMTNGDVSGCLIAQYSVFSSILIYFGTIPNTTVNAFDYAVTTSDGTQYEIVSSETFPLNTWYCIFLRFKRNGTMDIRVNNTTLGGAINIGDYSTSTAFADFYPYGNFTLGGSVDNSIVAPWYGKIDETIVWDKYLTDEECDLIYSSGAPVRKQISDLPQYGNIKAFWQFEETKGTLYDQTSNHYDLLCRFSTPTYGEIGIIDKSILNTASDFFQEYPGGLPHSLFDSLDEFTIMTWMYPINTYFQMILGSGNVQIFCYSNGGVLNELLFSLTAIDRVHTISSDEILELNTWYCIFFRFKRNGLMNMRVNTTTLGGEINIGDYSLGDSSNILSLYGYVPTSISLNPTYAFQGKIDETIVWDKYLTDEECTDLYSNGAPQRSAPTSFIPKQSGSVGHLIF